MKTQIKKTQPPVIVPQAVEPVAEVETLPVETAPIAESKDKVAYRGLIMAYAKQNPIKYEQKKEELERKLNNIK